MPPPRGSRAASMTPARRRQNARAQAWGSPPSGVWVPVAREVAHYHHRAISGVNLAQRGIACSLSHQRRGGFEDGNVCRFNARFRRDCPDQYGQSGVDISARQIHGPRL